MRPSKRLETDKDVIAFLLEEVKDKTNREEDPKKTRRTRRLSPLSLSKCFRDTV